jgi:undecaprenyl-diphosphatase
MEILIEIIKYIFLGAVQGVTEVLPISSSGHVAFFQEFLDLDIDSSVFFLIVLNLGSMIAVIFFLRKDIVELIIDFYKYVFKKNRDKNITKNFFYVKNVIIGIIPIGIFGFLITDMVSDLYLEYTFLLIGIGSLITATILYAVRNTTNANINLTFDGKDSFFIGVMQVFSIIPGLSRLGVTTAAGLNRKLSMDSALKFSFMMFIPISIGSILQQIIEYQFNPVNMVGGFDFSDFWHYLYYFLGFVTSIILTYYALKLVFIWFRRGNLGFFYIYNFIFGMIAIFIGVLR